MTGLAPARVLAHVNGGFRGPAIRGDPEARQVVQRHCGLVRAHVAGVRDPPPTVIAARVAVFIERRAGDHYAVLGRDDRVLEGPGTAGRVAVHDDLGLSGEVRGDDVRPE